MSDYIKSLEETVEELQQRLAVKESKYPVWVQRKNNSTSTIIYEYILNEKFLFGRIVHADPLPSRIMGRIYNKRIEGETVEEMKSNIEKEFLSLFITSE